jgi:hypothetical protein
MDSLSHTDPPRKAKMQFELTAASEAELNELQTLTNASTRVEVVRRALLFYSWFVHDVEVNSTLQVVDKEGKILSSFPVRILKSPPC